MLGTAFPAPRLVLVEQPGPWGRAGLLDSRFSRSVAHRLIARLDPAGVRVLAIRRPGRTAPSGRRRWALVDCRPGRETLRWGSFAEDADLLELDTDAQVQSPVLRDAELEANTPLPSAAESRSAAARDEPPVFLVCAHGTHDACCALRGRPIAAALAAVRPGQVWECSHVGGDRFAANVLVLPTGVLYGRVTESAVPLLAAGADAGVVQAEHLRGRVGLPPGPAGRDGARSPEDGWAVRRRCPSDGFPVARTGCDGGPGPCRGLNWSRSRSLSSSRRGNG